MIPFTVIALVVQGTLSMSDYYYDEWDSQWEKARAEDLILFEGDPVIIGCVEYHITEPENEANRAFIMRSYDISSQDTIWTFLYDGDTEIMDDDGYALLHYTIPTVPEQDRFLGTGFRRVYLGLNPVRLEDPAGLAVILDDQGDTVCGLHEFRESDWVDICSRDAAYIGEYDEYDYAYAVCGWYYETDGQGETVGPYGTVEIASGNEEIALIEDNGENSAWEKIIYDSENEVLILGGLEGIPAQDGSLDELQMAYIDLSSNSLEIESHEYLDPYNYSYNEGPLLLIDDGLYLYISSGKDEAYEGIVATLWTWDAANELVIQAYLDFMNDDEFEDYTQICPIAAEYYVSGEDEMVKLLLYAVNNEARPFYEVILLATINLDTGSHPMSITSLTVDEEFPFDPPSGHDYTPGVAAFVFTSLNPVEGIGCGAADYTESGVDYQQIMLFEIAGSQEEDSGANISDESTEMFRDFEFTIFPNPSRGTISFILVGAVTEPAILDVYDLSGRRIRTLSETEGRPETSTIIWDGLGENGEPLSAGVYLTRLHSGSCSAVRSVCLIR